MADRRDSVRGGDDVSGPARGAAPGRRGAGRPAARGRSRRTAARQPARNLHDYRQSSAVGTVRAHSVRDRVCRRPSRRVRADIRRQRRRGRGARRRQCRRRSNRAAAADVRHAAPGGTFHAGAIHRRVRALIPPVLEARFHLDTRVRGVGRRLPGLRRLRLSGRRRARADHRLDVRGRDVCRAARRMDDGRQHALPAAADRDGRRWDRRQR